MSRVARRKALAAFTFLAALLATVAGSIEDKICYGKRSIYHSNGLGVRGRAHQEKLDRKVDSFVREFLEKLPWDDYLKNVTEELEWLCDNITSRDSVSGGVLSFSLAANDSVVSCLNASGDFEAPRDRLFYGSGGGFSVAINGSGSEQELECMLGSAGSHLIHSSLDAPCELTLLNARDNLTVPESYIANVTEKHLDLDSSIDYFWCRINQTENECRDEERLLTLRSRLRVYGTVAGSREQLGSLQNDSESDDTDVMELYCKSHCPPSSALLRTRRSDDKNPKPPPGPFSKIVQSVSQNPGSSSSDSESSDGGQAIRIPAEANMVQFGPSGPKNGAFGVSRRDLDQASNELADDLKKMFPHISTDTDIRDLTKIGHGFDPNTLPGGRIMGQGLGDKLDNIGSRASATQSLGHDVSVRPRTGPGGHHAGPSGVPAQHFGGRGRGDGGARPRSGSSHIPVSIGGPGRGGGGAGRGSFGTLPSPQPGSSSDSDSSSSSDMPVFVPPPQQPPPQAPPARFPPRPFPPRAGGFRGGFHGGSSSSDTGYDTSGGVDGQGAANRRRFPHPARNIYERLNRPPTPVYPRSPYGSSSDSDDPYRGPGDESGPVSRAPGFEHEGRSRRPWLPPPRSSSSSSSEEIAGAAGYDPSSGSNTESKFGLDVDTGSGPVQPGRRRRHKRPQQRLPQGGDRDESSDSDSSSSDGGRRRCRRSLEDDALICGIASGASAESDSGGRSGDRLQKRLKKAQKQQRGQAAGLGAAFTSVSLSASHTYTVDRLYRGDFSTGDRGADIANVVSESLNKLGSSLAGAGTMAGSAKFMAVGLVGQSLGGLIDIGLAIYALVSGNRQEPDPDPVAELYSTYARYVATREAGARLCLLPDSRLSVTVAYRHRGMDAEAGEKSLPHASDTPPSVVQYLRTDLAGYTARVEVTCPRGTLRLLQGDIRHYLLRSVEGDDKAKHYFINAVAMVSDYQNATLTCGIEEGLFFVPYQPDPSEFQLLDRAGVGEPEYLRRLPSDVCDRFPFKRFYFLTSGCEYDRSQVAMTYTTCSVLLRRSLWDEKHRRWFAPDPFAHPGSDVKVFTFARYDFPDVPLKPNETPGHDDYCSVRDSQICYFSEPMVLDDQYTCHPRSRRLYVEIAPFKTTGVYSAIVITCPWLSTPTVLPPWAPVTRVNVGQGYTSAMFSFAEADQTASIYCQHNTNERMKSDLITVTSRVPGNVRKTIGWFDTRDSGDAERIRTILDEKFPKLAKTCIPNSYYISELKKEHWSRSDYELPKELIEKGEVRLIKRERIVVAEYADPADLDAAIIDRVGKYYPGAISATYDVTQLEDGYVVNKHLFWSNADLGLRTYHALVVSVFACAVRGSRYLEQKWDLIDEMIYYPLLTNNWGRDGLYAFSSFRSLCEATIKIRDRQLEVSCKSYSVPILLKGRQLCVSMTTSVNHCNGDQVAASRGCTLEESELGAMPKPGTPSSKMYYPGSYPQYYCYASAKNANVWRLPYYHVCRSFVLIYYHDLEIESQYFSPPPYPLARFFSPGDVIIPSALYALILELKSAVASLADYTQNPLIQEINAISAYLTQGGRQITRVFVDGEMLAASYEAREEKIWQLEDEIRSALVRIVDYISDQEEVRRRQQSEEHNQMQCCLLNALDHTSSEAYEDAKYACPDYEEFILTDDADNGTRYLMVNDSLGLESVYAYWGEPQISCSELVVVMLSSPEDIRDLQDDIDRVLIEEAMDRVFEEYDENVTEIIVQYLNETRNHSGYGPEYGDGMNLDDAGYDDYAEEANDYGEEEYNDGDYGEEEDDGEIVPEVPTPTILAVTLVPIVLLTLSTLSFLCYWQTRRTGFYRVKPRSKKTLKNRVLGLCDRARGTFPIVGTPSTVALLSDEQTD
ncbi:ORF050 [Saltwater crocodilepox virus]|nr:ORF050 [Saltwater crocodilepox virus]